ncbi:hypothetical protein ACFVH4_30105 [Nocardia ignorata]|uniref:hypothetical protein n=1 Tax=Nocardia ignorata TaxID=145285 RepID=UPI00363D682D
MTELYSMDGVGDELDRAYALADRYESPAYWWPSGDLLQKRSRRLADAHRRASHLLLVDVTADEMQLAVDLAGDPTQAGAVAIGEPYHGPVLIHAADPGLEYVIRFIPARHGEGWIDTTRIAVLHILGLYDAFRSTGSGNDPAAQTIRDSIALEFANGSLGNTRCDWQNHPHSYETRIHVTEMSVLILSRGAILQAWVCCPRCRSKLDAKFPGGLCWLP